MSLTRMNQSLALTQKLDKELSKPQKQFNNYVKKIQQLKAERTYVASQLEIIQVRVSGDLIPLERKLIDQRVAFVKILDNHHSDKFFKKKEKEKIADLVHTQCLKLITEYGREDLKEIFERHNDGQSFEEMNHQINQATADVMKNVVSSMFGVNFEEDADVDTPEKMRAYMAQKEAAQEAKKASGKKTAKQLEKEEKARQEAKNVSKTARAIYTDLVKEFHPDREQDETQKEHKTAIMHQVTEAYEQNDLFKLLQLKLELQATAPDALNLADEQLKYYNKILKEQAAELEEELFEMKGGMGFNGHYHRLGGDEKTMARKFTTEINRLKKNIKAYENDLKLLADSQYVRLFLKDYKIERELNFSDLFEI